MIIIKCDVLLRKKTALIICCLLLVLTLGGSRENLQAQAAPSAGQLSIVFTHDLHSYFLPHEVFTGEGQPARRGGYAKIARLIQQPPRSPGIPSGSSPAATGSPAAFSPRSSWFWVFLDCCCGKSENG